jgi:hypothetical protein
MDSGQQSVFFDEQSKRPVPVVRKKKGPPLRPGPSAVRFKLSVSVSFYARLGHPQHQAAVIHSLPEDGLKKAPAFFQPTRRDHGCAVFRPSCAALLPERVTRSAVVSKPWNSSVQGSEKVEVVFPEVGKSGSAGLLGAFFEIAFKQVGYDLLLAAR